MVDGTVKVEHLHDTHQCFPHVRGCSCDDLPNMICNPYFVDGHCPSFYEHEMEAEQEDKEHCPWLRVPVSMSTTDVVADIPDTVNAGQNV